MEKKMKHLEMIQGVINRMAGNSFMLKGWAVTLVAGIFALSAKDTDKFYFLLAYVPVLVFWGLDSYYLLEERLYRSLYNEVRATDEGNIDFSLKATSEDFPDKKNTYVSSLISPTECGFYLPLAILCALVIWLNAILS